MFFGIIANFWKSYIGNFYFAVFLCRIVCILLQNFLTKDNKMGKRTLAVATLEQTEKKEFNLH